jgi:tetratricopeptide (TPR) repeat protein
MQREIRGCPGRSFSIVEPQRPLHREGVRIQQIDPGFGGGYAAESLQLWNYVLFGHSTDPDADALRALELARKAVELDPEFSWGQHALAQALHINKDLAGAIGASRRAVDLDPGEPDHHGYLGLFLALSGDGAEGAKHTTTAVELSDSVRAPYRNFLGIAHFHARQFDQAAEAIQRNRDDGGPTGPHMLLFLAASNALANHDGRAAAAAQLVRNDDSGFEPMPFVDGLYEISTERDLLLNGLAQAGVTFVPHE